MSNGHDPERKGLTGIMEKLITELNKTRLGNIIARDIGLGNQPPEIIPEGKTRMDLADDLLATWRQKGFSPQAIARALQNNIEGEGDFGMRPEDPIGTNPGNLPQRTLEHSQNLPEFDPRGRFNALELQKRGEGRLVMDRV